MNQVILINVQGYIEQVLPWNDICQKSEFCIEPTNTQYKTTIQLHKCSQYNLLSMPFVELDALFWKRATLSVSNISGRNSKKISVSPEQK